MHNSAVVSSWSIDAFECLSQKLFRKMSVEQISRIEMFISAFVMFDEVYLIDKYKNKEIPTELNIKSNNALKFISSKQLVHSTDMIDHISFDIDLHKIAFESLAKENNIWHLQNDPDLGFELFSSNMVDAEIQAAIDSKIFTNLRLWHWCLANEISEVTGSVCMLPVSLNAVSKFALRKKEISDLILNKYLEYAKFHNQKFVKLSEVITTPFISELKYIPPLFSLFLSRCKSSDDTTNVLTDMRREFSEFRQLRHKFTNEIDSANTISEKTNVVSEWNASWENLFAGEFKKSSLLSRKISSSEVSSAVVSVETGGAKAIVKSLLDHYQYKKSYKQFRIFSEIDGIIGDINADKRLLHSVFGIEEIVPLKKT